MFNGFQSRPPVVTNQTDNFDVDLPDISVQDVETIVEHCKEHISEKAFEEVCFWYMYNTKYFNLNYC